MTILALSHSLHALTESTNDVLFLKQGIEYKDKVHNSFSPSLVTMLGM